MRPHQKLEAWAKGIELVIAIYKNSEHFPKEERYGSQVKFVVQQFRYRPKLVV